MLGVVEHITFQSDESGYTVARMAGEDGQAFTAVGSLLGIGPGARLRLWGEWTRHAKFGRQFKVERFVEVVPATLEGIRQYLGGGSIKGIGPVTATKIVDHFGHETLDILDETPERLAEVHGIGAQRVETIARSWASQRAVKDVMIFLQGQGLATGLASRIVKHYGAEATSLVQRDPYRLAREVHGIGFLTADRIARTVGLPADSPRRVDAGILYTLERLADDGHTHPPEEHVLASAAERLELTEAMVADGLERLVETGDVAVEATDGADRVVALRPLHAAEVSVAHRLGNLLRTEESMFEALRGTGWDVRIDAAERGSPHPLDAGQRRAVTFALDYPVAVITGGPGTGKTTTLRTLLRVLDGRRVALAAPTGRAAKRLSEATGLEAKTIHRLLEFDARDMGFRRNEDRPLDAELVVIDEASMLDISLASSLAKALMPGAHLLLVGDADQLPSVGPGNVLADVIESGVVPAARLTEIFRQAADSHIVVNAHRINAGEMPVFSKSSRDCFMFRIEEAQRASEMLIDVVARRIPDRFGHEPRQDIQVLTPMHRGPAGVAELNRGLQAALNPAGPSRPELRLGERIYRLGDRVMQTRNNYDADVFNGDIGLVVEVDPKAGRLVVEFEVQRVSYDKDATTELTLAYACSIHKSQGSEFRVVVMALVPGHYLLLQRNLVYTGITRARELFVFVGSQKAMGMAVSNTSGTDRFTRLAPRLKAAARATSPLP